MEGGRSVSRGGKLLPARLASARSILCHYSRENVVSSQIKRGETGAAPGRIPCGVTEACRASSPVWPQGMRTCRRFTKAMRVARSRTPAKYILVRLSSNGWSNTSRTWRCTPGVLHTIRRGVEATPCPCWGQPGLSPPPPGLAPTDRGSFGGGATDQDRSSDAQKKPYAPSSPSDHPQSRQSRSRCRPTLHHLASRDYLLLFPIAGLPVRHVEHTP